MTAKQFLSGLLACRASHALSLHSWGNHEPRSRAVRRYTRGGPYRRNGCARENVLSTAASTVQDKGGTQNKGVDLFDACVRAEDAWLDCLPRAQHRTPSLTPRKLPRPDSTRYHRMSTLCLADHP